MSWSWDIFLYTVSQWWLKGAHEEVLMIFPQDRCCLMQLFVSCCGALNLRAALRLTAHLLWGWTNGPHMAQMRWWVRVPPTHLCGVVWAVLRMKITALIGGKSLFFSVNKVNLKNLCCSYITWQGLKSMYLSIFFIGTVVLRTRGFDPLLKD